MVITYDTRILEQKLRTSFHCILPLCKNCGEELDYYPISYNYKGINEGRIVTLTRTFDQWVHAAYSCHPQCPLAADIKLRPLIPTHGEP